MKTINELNGAIERLNASLEISGYYLKVGHRNGYTALDLHRIKDDRCQDNFMAGLNDKKTLETVYCMCKAVELLYNPIDKTKTFINNNLRVYQVVTSTGKQAFCNIEQLNSIVKELGCAPGYFTINHFWDNKAKKVSKKDLKTFFEGAQLTQNFTY